MTAADKPPGEPAGEAAAEREKTVDEDWKKKAEAEAKGLDEALDGETSAGEGPSEMPPADFLTLVASLVGQSMIHLGVVEHPIAKTTKKDLKQARYTIDLIGVLERKTKGNLDPEEKRFLESALADLRFRYVMEAGK